MKQLSNEQKDRLIRVVMGTFHHIHLRRLIDLARVERAWGPRHNVMTEADREKMRMLAKRRGLSMREIARRVGTTNGFVSQVFGGKRGASTATVAKFWRALR